MYTIFIIIILLVVANFIAPTFKTIIQNAWDYLLNRHSKKMEAFDEYFIEPKRFYWNVYKTLPSITYIENLDIAAVLSKIQTGEFGNIKAIYQRNYYNWQEQRLEFERTLIQLSNKIVIRLKDDWVDIYFNIQDNHKIVEMVEALKTLQMPEKKKDFEINIISLNGSSLDLKTLSIEPTNLDVHLYYNDDFIAIDAIIKERLSKEKDKGIVLLHGLPGTGKTTYLRYLIGSLKKKVMFVSPAVASNLMNPEFMDLLLDNPNTILVIEDAENIIMDRRYSSQSSVSNLLNISDGLLSDCLNVQIICTFNSDIALIDNALLRKGRLIAKYEFGKLSTEKANALSNYLNLNKTFYQPMTIAEITNHSEEIEAYQPRINQVIGFRRALEVFEN